MEETVEETCASPPADMDTDSDDTDDSDADDAMVYVVKAITEMRGMGDDAEFRVRWKGNGEDEDEWLPRSSLDGT